MCYDVLKKAVEVEMIFDEITLEDIIEARAEEAAEMAAEEAAA